MVTEENFRLLKDFSFVKESFYSINDLNENQKSFLFLFCKILNDNYGNEFETLLFNQEESFLIDFLAFQEEYMNKMSVN